MNGLESSSVTKSKVLATCFSSSNINLCFLDTDDNNFNAEVSILPSDFSYNKGENFSISVEISTENEVYAVEFELNFDSEVLKIVNVEKGNFLSQDDADTYEIISSSDGKITYAETRIGVQNGVSGQGNLLVIEFKAENTGITDLTLSNVKIADPSLDVDKFEVSINNGNVTVS